MPLKWPELKLDEQFTQHCLQMTRGCAKLTTVPLQSDHVVKKVYFAECRLRNVEIWKVYFVEFQMQNVPQITP